VKGEEGEEGEGDWAMVRAVVIGSKGCGCGGGCGWAKESYWGWGSLEQFWV
jgi:hypothetical protein